MNIKTSDLSDVFYAHASQSHGRKTSVSYTAKSKLNYYVCRNISVPYSFGLAIFVGEIKHITSKIGLVAYVSNHL